MVSCVDSCQTSVSTWKIHHQQLLLSTVTSNSCVHTKNLFCGNKLNMFQKLLPVLNLHSSGVNMNGVSIKYSSGYCEIKQLFVRALFTMSVRNSAEKWSHGFYTYIGTSPFPYNMSSGEGGIKLRRININSQINFTFYISFFFFFFLQK